MMYSGQNRRYRVVKVYKNEGYVKKKCKVEKAKDTNDRELRVNSAYFVV